MEVDEVYTFRDRRTEPDPYHTYDASSLKDVPIIIDHGKFIIKSFCTTSLNSLMNGTFSSFFQDLISVVSAGPTNQIPN